MKRGLFTGILVVLVIGILETSIALLAFVWPRVDHVLAAPWTAATADRRLCHRPTPGFPGHDRKGFRNPGVPTSAHIVALGDSQTYGAGVGAESAWPRMLESAFGKNVYSLAYPGYGPTHSLILWDEAATLSPRIVIEAFYSGNDLYDSFNLLYNLGQLSELKSSESQVLESIEEAERLESIEKHVDRMYNMGRTPVEPEVGAFRRFVSQHSMLYALLRRARYEISNAMRPTDAAPGVGRAFTSRGTAEAQWKEAKAFAQANPAYCQVFDDGRFRTIFTSEYRFAALNLQDVRIAEGLRISLAAIRRMHEWAAARDIRFLVLLIPTKEAVFEGLWQNPSASYRSLAETEQHMWRRTRDFLEQHSIEYVDALPALRAQLARGGQPYQVSIDGHPNELGHRAIAELLAAHLRSQ